MCFAAFKATSNELEAYDFYGNKNIDILDAYSLANYDSQFHVNYKKARGEIEKLISCLRII